MLVSIYLLDYPALNKKTEVIFCKKNFFIYIVMHNYSFNLALFST